MTRLDLRTLTPTATSAPTPGSDEQAETPGRRVPQRRDFLANQERVLAAAVTAMLRDGHRVPMSRIAEEAGVGVGTLYRHYPDREALLDALTERSFELVRALAEEAAASLGPAIISLDRFFEGTLGHRDQLVLPLHGGPPAMSVAARQAQEQISSIIAALLQRGHEDGTVRQDVTPRDVVVFGAMLAQPLPNAPDWDHTARRQKDIFLAGLNPGRSPGLVDPPHLSARENS